MSTHKKQNKSKVSGGDTECKYCHSKDHDISACDRVRCTRCGETGHIEKVCKLPPTVRIFVCSNCKGVGHIFHSCPTLICSKCNLPGHSFVVCPATSCSHCESYLHGSDECPFCQYCKIYGEHSTENCETKPMSLADQMRQRIETSTPQPSPAVRSGAYTQSSTYKKVAQSEEHEQKEALFCDYCERRGHLSENCWKKSTCSRCHRRGHIFEKCYADLWCSHCESDEHLPEDCEAKDDHVCQLCSEKGHLQEECRNRRRPMFCRVCHKPGHHSDMCPSEYVTC